MRSGRSRDGTVVRAGVDALEPTMRVCREHNVDPGVVQRISARISDAIDGGEVPAPEDAILDGPLFVSYGPGGFFRKHRDTASHADDPAIMRDRIWSFVLYLNGRQNVGALPSFDGGALAIYDSSVRGPDQRRVVVPEPGLLIFFRSDLLHQVAPVREGTRYAVIGFICASKGRSSS